MVDAWPGTPVKPIQASPPQWPGTPTQPPQQQTAPQWPGTPTEQKQLVPQPDPATAGRPSNPILIQAVKSAAEPITSLPGEYQKIVGESVEQMKSGVQSFKEGDRVLGGLRAGFGAMRYAFSPIEAPVHTIVGKPIEQATGIPHEWTEFATMLGMPGIGIASSGPGKAVLRPLEKIVSPGTVSPIAGEAEAALRAARGTAARDTAVTAAEVEPYHKLVNAMPDTARLDFMDYVEGQRTGPLPQQVQQFADTLRKAFELRKNKLLAMPSTMQAQFIEDYFPHMWQDPGKAQQFAQSFGGAGKQGSGASLKARTIPTIAEGIRAGLVPLTTDPIEATMRYVSSMDKFIASTSVLDAAKANGTVRYIRPKTMGASGHPDSFKVPDGWVPIKGRGSVDATGAQAYAPEEWAEVYNNHVSQGFYAWPAFGNVYEKAQIASNAITSMELGLSGFHTFTMAAEAVISEFARGITAAMGGKPIDALKAFVKSPAAPILTAIRGHKAEQVYLGRSPGTPDYRRVVDLQEQAGGRAVGKSHAPDYRLSAMENYFTAFKRGSLKQNLYADLAKAKSQPIRTGLLTAVGAALGSPFGPAGMVAGGVLMGTRQMGRVMETIAMPIFEKYIPKLKNGAFYENMSQWLKMNPKASYDEQVAAARSIWDSVDNRFGEMVNDNIFWNATLKQSAQLAMRSYSWNLGTVREIGGGVRDISKFMTGQGGWTDKASYTIALPIVSGTLNAAYQYLKTGVSPQSPDDLLGGQTGGSAPGFGSRGTVPERVMMPGYMKDVLGWHEDWWREAKNKIATGPSMVGQALSGENWRGDPIARPDADVPQWLADYFKWVTESMGPISLRQLAKGQKTGSNISNIESIMGLRPAPAYVQDPEGYTRGTKAIQTRKWKAKEKYERRQEGQYGGPQE
jgi:hypothetical protein